MEVHVDRAAEALPERLRGAERQLEARDEVDVEGVEVPDHRPQLAPGPARARRRTSARCAARSSSSGARRGCSAPAPRRSGRRASSRSSPPRNSRAFGGEILSHLDQRDDLPVRRDARVETGERVGDPAPLLDRRRGGIAAVDLVPDQGAEDADLRHARNVFAAPYTPAVPTSSPGTMRQAATAGLKARRAASRRSGTKRWSPASVTPPQITTTSGLKMLSRLATPTPRNLAVSFTTSSASSSPSCAAS